jgi:hypothetical protein
MFPGNSCPNCLAVDKKTLITEVGDQANVALLTAREPVGDKLEDFCILRFIMYY